MINLVTVHMNTLVYRMFIRLLLLLLLSYPVHNVHHRDIEATTKTAKKS